MIPKFRAWIKHDKKMKDVLAIDFEIESIETENEDDTLGVVKNTYNNFDDVELMQSTGVFDKNGIEIYEGDILEFKYIYDKRFKETGVIVRREDKACFGIEGIRDLTEEIVELYKFTAKNYLTVIGNIYENPELLNKESNDD